MRTIPTQFVFNCVLASVFFASALTLTAATNTFVTPAFRGSAGSQSAFIETFASAYQGINTGLLPLGASSLAPIGLVQTSNTNAFLTSTANIYTPAGTSAFVLNYTGSFAVGQVSFQTRTTVGGNQLDYNSFQLFYDLGAGAINLAPGSSVITSPDSGGGATAQFLWDLSGMGNLQNFNILFNAPTANTSFDSVMFDVAPVPEPGTVSLLALAAVGSLGFRFLRRNNNLSSNS